MSRARDAPPLPGGYKVGEKVFFTAANETLPSGDKLVRGQQGEVTGSGVGSSRTEDKGLAVFFPGNKAHINGIGCLLTEVSRDAPLPGGYKVGEKVFFTGASYTWDDGDKRVHGQQGKVTGPGTGVDLHTHVAVRFPGNTDSIECLLNAVSRNDPKAAVER